MTRVIEGIQAIITARYVGGSPALSKGAAFAQIEDVLVDLQGNDFECEVAYEIVARCEHCRARWPDENDPRNGDCCDRNSQIVVRDMLAASVADLTKGGE